MADTITIEVDDTRIHEALNRLLQVDTDLSPVMAVIAGHLADSARESFNREAAPGGDPWAPLSPTTSAERTQPRRTLPSGRVVGGYRAGPKLQRDGDLKNSILQDWDATSAIVGTNKDYATTQQFGAQRGAFGTIKRGGPVPWGNIPARPFLGLWPEHAEEILADVRNYITVQWE